MRVMSLVLLATGLLIGPTSGCGDSTTGQKDSSGSETSDRRDGSSESTSLDGPRRDATRDGLFDGPIDGRKEGPIERFDGGETSPDGPRESSANETSADGPREASTSDGPDAGVDAPADGSVDSSADSSNDAPDSSVDSSVDSTSDAVDSSVDSSVDSTSDAVDSSVDATADSTNDAVDSSVDSTADASRDFPATPQTFYWADWTASTSGASGTATGSIAPPSGTVQISYAGEVAGAQTSGGTNYWNPGGPYINALTQNAPPAADIIRLIGPSQGNTITFNPPVRDLVMAIVSLGAPSRQVTYSFNVPFTLLSFGAGYWGNGTITQTSPTSLSGAEGHGAVVFHGTVSQLTWSVSTNENWHGFTVGIPTQSP